MCAHMQQAMCIPKQAAWKLCMEPQDQCSSKKKKKWNHMEVSFFLADERCLNKLVRLNMFYQKKKKTNEKASGDKLNVLKKG